MSVSTRSPEANRLLFEALEQKWRVQFMSMARSLVGGRGHEEDVKDVYARCCDRVWEKFFSIPNPEYSFWSYMRASVTNTSINLLRYRRSHQTVPLDVTDTFGERQMSYELPDPRIDVEGEVVGRAALIACQRVVREAIEYLPDHQREVIVLYYYERKEYEDIAEIVGRPIGTVKSRLSRGRLNLKELITQGSGNEEGAINLNRAVVETSGR